MCASWVKTARNLSKSFEEKAETKRIKLDPNSSHLCNTCHSKLHNPNYDATHDVAGPSRLDSISQGKIIIMCK